MKVAGVGISRPREGLIIDGSVTHESLPFEGTRYSIVAFLHKNANSFAEKRLTYLREIGFRLEPSGGVAGKTRRLVQTR